MAKRTIQPVATAKAVQTKAQEKRVIKALEGKNFRQIVLQINNQFPEVRTGDLNSMLLRMYRGDFFDAKILEAVEALDIPVDTVE